MSIAKLRKKMRQKGLRTIVWGGLLLIFLVSCFLGYGSLMGGSSTRVQLAPGVVAKVGRKKIVREEYNDLLQRQMENYSRYGGVRFSNEESIKKSVLDNMVDRILKERACRDERIKVRSGEVDDKIENMMDQQIESLKMQAGSARRFALQVKKKYGSLPKLKDEIRSQLKDNEDGITEQVRTEKLQEKIKAQVKVTLSEYRRSTEEVKARHILIKPEPTPAEREAGKDGKADKGRKGKTAQQQSAEAAAKKKADDLLARLKKGESFEALAKQYSEDYSNASQGGDLGWFPRGRMVKEFDDTAFRLKKGELSGVVKTEFGYHIIQLEDKRLNLPPDYNDVTYKCEKKGCDNEWTTKDTPQECPKCKSKKFRTVKRRREELLAQYADQKKWEHWRDYEEKLKKEADVQIIDPELHAYELETQGKTAEAIKLYKEALKSWEGDPLIKPGPIYFHLAQLYERDGKKQEAIRDYEQANTYEEDAEAHLALGKLLKDDKKTRQKATEHLKSASDLSYDDTYRHQELKRLFEELGEKDLAKKEQDLYDQAQRANPQQPFSVTPQ